MHRVALVVQVQALEPHEGADLRRRLHVALLRRRAAQHVRLAVRGRDLGRLVERPHGGLGLGEDARRDVGREDLDLPPGARREVMEEHHRERVRLLARRAPGAPDAQDPGGAALLPRGDHVALEELELPRLAEEVRLVRADAVEHLDALVAVVLVHDARVVRAERRQVERAQPLREPAHEQRLLGRREEDPRLAQDQRLEECELPLRDLADALARLKGRAGGAAGGHRHDAASAGAASTAASSPEDRTRSVSRIRTNSLPSLPRPWR